MEKEILDMCYKYSKEYPITPEKRRKACMGLYRALGHESTELNYKSFISGSTGILCVKTVKEKHVDKISEYMRKGITKRGIIYYTKKSKLGNDKEVSFMLKNIEIIHLSELIKLVDKCKNIKTPSIN